VSLKTALTLTLTLASVLLFLLIPEETQNDIKRSIVSFTQSSKDHPELTPSDAKTAPKNNPKDPFDPGSFEPIPLDSNRDTESIREALETGKYPERLSASIAPKPFNRQEFNKDPQKYIHTIEPGRVFATAQPGKDVPATKIKGPKFHEVEQGKSVTLKVQSASNSPITFSSMDAGAFKNKLPSITVMTNNQGEAQVEFYGTPGTVGDCHILAGSPEAWGQANFLVVVSLNTSEREDQ